MGKAFPREKERARTTAQAPSLSLREKQKQAFPLSLVASACSSNFESCALTLVFLAFPLDNFPTAATTITGDKSVQALFFCFRTFYCNFLLRLQDGGLFCGFSFPVRVCFPRWFCVFRCEYGTLRQATIKTQREIGKTRRRNFCQIDFYCVRRRVQALYKESSEEKVGFNRHPKIPNVLKYKLEKMYSK